MLHLTCHCTKLNIKCICLGEDLCCVSFCITCTHACVVILFKSCRGCKMIIKIVLLHENMCVLFNERTTTSNKYQTKPNIDINVLFFSHHTHVSFIISAWLLMSMCCCTYSDNAVFSFPLLCPECLSWP